MSTMEQSRVETTSPASGDEGTKGGNIDLSKESIDTQKSLEAIGTPSETGDKEAQNRLDGIADSNSGGDGGDGGDGKPDDFSEQSIEPSEKLNEIKETSPEYKEAQQQTMNEAQQRLDGIADK